MIGKNSIGSEIMNSFYNANNLSINIILCNLIVLPGKFLFFSTRYFSLFGGCVIVHFPVFELFAMRFLDVEMP